jgi:hypothetical protein
MNVSKENTTDFYLVIQSNSINTLTKLNTKGLMHDRLGDAEIRCGDNFVLRIRKYKSFENKNGKIFEKENGMNTLSYMFLDILLIKFAQTKDLNIRFKLHEYMDMRGLKDRTAAREQVLQSIEALSRIEYEAYENIKGKWIYSGLVSIFGGSGFIKNGMIHFNFNSDFYNLLLNYSVMNYSTNTLKSDPRTNSYYFSRYIDENYRINEGKKRVNKITVKTLISRSPNLPKFEEVIDRHYKERIIIPFIRDLNKLEHIEYRIINNKNEVVIDPEKMLYKDFINSAIYVDYKNYPRHNKSFIKNKNRGNTPQIEG